MTQLPNFNQQDIVDLNDLTRVREEYEKLNNEKDEIVTALSNTECDEFVVHDLCEEARRRYESKKEEIANACGLDEESVDQLITEVEVIQETKPDRSRLIKLDTFVDDLERFCMGGNTFGDCHGYRHDDIMEMILNNVDWNKLARELAENEIVECGYKNRVCVKE